MARTLTKCFECNKIIHATESPHYYGGKYSIHTGVFCSAICLTRWIEPYVEIEKRKLQEKQKAQAERDKKAQPAPTSEGGQSASPEQGYQHIEKPPAAPSVSGFPVNRDICMGNSCVDTPKPESQNRCEGTGISALVKDNLTSVWSDCSKFCPNHKEGGLVYGNI